MKALSPLRITDENLSETEKVGARQGLLRQELSELGDLPELFSLHGLPETVGQKNCENWLGSISLPVGVAGPVRVIFEGQAADHYLPLATTEGALVASVSRGAKALSLAGGVKVLVKKVGMSRAPVFVCQSGAEAQALLEFVENNFSRMKEIGESDSRHLRLIAHQGWVRGRHLYLRLVFDPDAAMGMNMVTIATQKIADWLEEQVPKIKLVALSSNVCSDKKDNLVNTFYGRGYWAQAEAWLPEAVVRKVLKTESQQLVTTHIQKNLVGSNVAGSLSQNAQVANVLAGIFLATGQDPAHVVEGSRAFLSVEPEADGIYVSLTLPNLNMGTVGGGTYLPAQTQARQVLGSGELSPAKLVAVTAAGCLAGELSLLASLGEKSLAQAHQNLAR